MDRPCFCSPLDTLEKAAAEQYRCRKSAAPPRTQQRTTMQRRKLAGAAVELTADDLREIATAAGKIQVQGARYPEKIERMTGR
jgi:hypothetical protein